MRAASEGTARQHRGENARRQLRTAHRVPDERAYLYQIIQTIGSGPNLETILRGIVRLVTEATACHACFVYFERDGHLELRAASSMYARLEGHIRIPIGEGLTGWVAKARRSAFIRESALDDSRVQRAYFPELDDEHYQSLVSVPIFARSGDVIGVITLHADAPHEFAPADLNFLEHTASLISGAVENARLYEDATARVEVLTNLSRLSQRIASSASIDEVLRHVTSGGRHLFPADRCEIYLLEADGFLHLRAASPARRNAPTVDTKHSWLEAMEPGAQARGSDEARRLAAVLWRGEPDGVPMVAPLVAGDERLGVLVLAVREPVPDADTALAAVAAHTAVAIKQHQVIEWLKEKHLVKDFFQGLSRTGADHAGVAASAARLGCDLDSPHLLVHVVSWPPRTAPARRASSIGAAAGKPLTWRELAGQIESRLSARFPGMLVDHLERAIRALVPDPANGETLAALRAMEWVRHGAPLSVGVSSPCQGVSAFARGFEEAASAAEVGGLIRGQGVTAYEDLGPYKYVLSLDAGLRDRRQQQLERLVDYDRRRGTQLLSTLEGYLDHRGNVLGTSRALFIHPNTLRQRLGRIEQVAEVNLKTDDWLSLAVATKAVKLRLMRRKAGEERKEGGEDG